MWGRPALAFVNAAALLPDGAVAERLRIRRGRIASIGEAPRRGDVVVDLHGDVLVPGLINAHDHLELNSFGRLKWRPRYDNVAEWIDDFQPRFATDPRLAGAVPSRLEARLWAGAMKNLLAGVTTVCHHNPLHRALGRAFPVRVVRAFRMSHSLGIDGEAAVAAACRATPPSQPWIVHAAEGVDERAGVEIDTLDALGCLRRNTVIVHGVGIRPAQAARLIAAGAALVWCPTSNAFLFGRTADATPFARARLLALGTDSRLSGEGDLLDEIRVAAGTGQVGARDLFHAVTCDAAAILRVAAGRVETGAFADVTVIRRLDRDPFTSLVVARRRDVRLTMIGGRPVVADLRLAGLFSAARQQARIVSIDGEERLVAAWIANRAASLGALEDTWSESLKSPAASPAAGRIA